jgi:hypothetical protein
MATQDRTKPPTQADLMALSRWARVAFAARCARRVQPLYAKAWPDAPDRHREALEKAIALAESAARSGRAAEDARLAASNAYAATMAAAVPNVIRAGVIRADASNAANAAGFAASTAGSAANADAANAAYSAAAIAAAADAHIVREMWSDFDRLAAEAAKESWTDDSPVDPDFCGPLWPDVVPEWWPGRQTADDRSKPPAETDLKALPRWARVAFAARCARRVQPLFMKAWPNAPAKHREALDNVIGLTESSARTGRVAEGLTTDATDGTNAIAAVNAAVTAADRDAATASSFASRAATSAGFASIFAYTTDDASRAAANAAIAGADADASVASLRAMWADVDLLLAMAASSHWTDETRVDPDLCGSLWPFGRPDGWPVEPARDDDAAGIKLVLDFPDTMSDAQIAEEVKRRVNRLDDLHRALGGKGLRLIRPIEMTEPAGVRQGVGS